MNKFKIYTIQQNCEFETLLCQVRILKRCEKQRKQKGNRIYRLMWSDKTSVFFQYVSLQYSEVPKKMNRPH